MEAPAPTKARSGLYSLFVDRPVLTLMVSFALLVVGVIALLRLPLRLTPEGLVRNQINVWIPIARPMAPREVEEDVLKPFEALLRTIPGIKSVTANASATSAFVSVELSQDLDVNLAAAEVRDKAQRARLEWPQEVDRYFTWREDGSAMPLAFFQMLTPARNADWDYRIDQIVRPRLEAVDGVGRVEMWGLLDETLRIWFDTDKLRAASVNYRELVERLARDNFAEPVGELDDGSSRVLLRVDTKFRTASQIEEYPVRPGLRLADVARVERVPTVRSELSRYNQKYTYSGAVRLAASANPVDSSERLRAACAALQAEPTLEGIEFRFLFDQGEFIRGSIETLVSSALQGGALAVVILWLFLRDLRFTLVIALSIPITMLIVGGWLYFTGDTLNVLTMAGMTIAIGMVVDNSVVVLENIRRLRAAGHSLRDACVAGAREVGLAVTLATLTTVVVFLPMVFMSGSTMTRTLLGAVGIPLSVALIGSLLVALLLLPSGVRQLAAGVTSTRAEAARGIGWLTPIRWLMAVNAVLLRWSLRHRVLALVACTAVLGTTAIAWGRLDTRFQVDAFNPFRGGDVTVRLQIPGSLTLAEVDAEVKLLEEFALANKERWRIAGVSSRFSRTSIRIDLVLERGLEPKQVAEIRTAVLAEWPRRPGLRPTLRESGRGMGGGGGGEQQDLSNFVLRLYGRDSEYLANLAVDVVEDLRRQPEVASVEAGELERNKEVVVEINRDRAQELGIPPENLFGVMTSGLRGRELTRFEEEGREIRLIAQYEGGNKYALKDLKEAQVFASRGTFQRLGDVGTVRFQPMLPAIERKDGKTSLVIVGKRAPDVGANAFGEVLKRVMDRYVLPRGYSWAEDSASRDTQMQIRELLQAMLLSVTLVFLLMGVLFESLILPLATLVTIPFALFGAVWGLLLFRGSIDVMAVVGLVLLCGVVVNNGIVLLDCVQQRRREGLNREAALLEAVHQRLRPILMTAATTIVGLLPMILFGDPGAQGLSYIGMALVVAGGLAVCTFFTAYAVPLAYTWMDDLSLWLRGIWLRAIARRAQVPASNANPQSL